MFCEEEISLARFASMLAAPFKLNRYTDVLLVSDFDVYEAENMECSYIGRKKKEAQES